jgi:hypothetical protein
MLPFGFNLRHYVEASVLAGMDGHLAAVVAKLTSAPAPAGDADGLGGALGTVAAGTVAGGTVAAGTVAAGTVAGGTVAGGTVAGGTVREGVTEDEELLGSATSAAAAEWSVDVIAAAAAKLAGEIAAATTRVNTPDPKAMVRRCKLNPADPPIARKRLVSTLEPMK